MKMNVSTFTVHEFIVLQFLIELKILRPTFDELMHR